MGSFSQMGKSLFERIFTADDASEFCDLLIQLILFESEKDEKMRPPSSDTVWLIHLFHVETFSGGISKYLSDNSGSQFYDLLQALEAVGATKILTILKDVEAKFMPQKVSDDQAVRQDQIDELEAKQEGRDAFEIEDKRILQSGENLEQLIMQYILPRKDEYRGLGNR